MKPAVLARANAARALNEVLGRSRTIDWVEARHGDWIDSPLTRELTMGTLRHYFSLSAAVRQQLSRPLRKKDQIVECLLLVGAYQLGHTRIKPHAVVNETVAACTGVGREWAKGLVNAVLRNLAEPERSIEHPDWLADALRDQYGAHSTDLMHSNNLRAPMTLRVNRRRTDPDQYSGLLNAARIEHRRTELPEAIVLDEPCPAATLPGWAEGLVSVQDLGAQFTASLVLGRHVQTEPDRLRVLDACTAPGNKLCHLLEALPSPARPGQVTGLEVSPRRAETTRGQVLRLGHTAEVEVADATHLDWWDGQPYDHVLLDAPCSGTGTLRRHPDIKVLLQPDQIAGHARLQLQLLNNLWRTVAPGGTLLYCTCSLLTQENDEVIGAFLSNLDENRQDTPPENPRATDPGKEQQEAEVIPMTLPTGRATRYGWQLLPTDPRTDGFYYALIARRGPGPDPR